MPLNAMMAAGGRQGAPGVLLFRGWGLESRIGAGDQSRIAALRDRQPFRYTRSSRSVAPAPGQSQRLLRVRRGRGLDDGALRLGVAGDGAVLLGRLVHQGLQDDVADGVAEEVVDLLEVVDVEGREHAAPAVFERENWNSTLLTPAGWRAPAYGSSEEVPVMAVMEGLFV